MRLSGHLAQGRPQGGDFGRGQVVARAKMLERLGKLWPSSRQAQLPWDGLGKGRKAIAEVLYQAMTTAQGARCESTLEAAHRTHPLLQMAMIPLNSIVQVARTTMLGVGKDCNAGRAGSTWPDPWSPALVSRPSRQSHARRTFAPLCYSAAPRNRRQPPAHAHRSRGRHMSSVLVSEHMSHQRAT